MATITVITTSKSEKPVPKQEPERPKSKIPVAKRKLRLMED